MENFAMRPVSPVRPVAAWIGGKRQLASRLVDLIARVPHAIYAEPFVGMGGVFLRRARAPAAEVINDLSGDVATFFRILQRHYVPFMDMLRFQLTSRRDFERLMATDPSTLTDLERSARFLYLQRLAFGGKVAGRTFGVSPGMPGRFDVSKLEPLLAELNDRLAGVIIENLDFRDFIERYDRPDALFYCDPPYFGSEGYYGAGMFEPAAFAELAARLATIKGGFILTINDAPEMRRIFSGFSIEPVSLSYSVDEAGPKAVTELIITPSGLVQNELAADLFSDRV